MEGNPFKKLRCGKPDLKVILEYTEEEGKAQKKKVYPMYSSTLAGLSNFVDTSLSIEMKEKATREIILKDVTPELFQKAMKYQQDFAAIRTMEATDALEVVSFYHMYEFSGGLELCDSIIAEHMKTNKGKDLNFLVQTAAMAYKYDLPKSLLQGIDILNTKVLLARDHPIRAAMLTTKNIQMLQPMFKEGVLTLPISLSLEDASCSLFPRYFVKAMSSNFLGGNTRKCARLFLCGASSFLESAAPFHFQDGFKWRCRNVCNCVIQAEYAILYRADEHDMNWVIARENIHSGHVVNLWQCPNSGDADVPPSGPWEPLDSSVEGVNPTLTYSKNN